MKKVKRLKDSIERMREHPCEVWMVKLADRISNLQIPPFDWSNEKIKSYWKSSKKIHKNLNSASPYLEKRLQEKIQNYEQYII